MFRFAVMLPLAWILACTEAAVADSWTLDADSSRISFVSIKAGEIAEPNHFTNLSGSIEDSGTATVTIGLESVETMVDIRNERMRKFFFETAEFPVATITAQVDLDSFKTLKAGERRRETLAATLDLHGVSETVEAEVFVTRAGEDSVTVETVDPIIVNTGAFNLTEGLNKLMELAGLDTISPDVPVTFSLVFKSVDA